MNSKISSSRSMYLPAVVEVIIIIALVLALPQLLSLASQTGFYWYQFPWMNAAGILINQGVEAFSGNPHTPLETAFHVSTLIALISEFILLPTLFFFGIRWLKLNAEKVVNTTLQARGWRIAAYTCGLLFYFGFAVISVPNGLIHRDVRTEIMKGQETADERDALQYVLSSAGYDAMSYRIVLKDYAGGGGSFTEYPVPAQLVENGMFDIHVASATDSTIRFTGSSKTAPADKITLQVSGADGAFAWEYEGKFVP